MKDKHNFKNATGITSTTELLGNKMNNMIKKISFFTKWLLMCYGLITMLKGDMDQLQVWWCCVVIMLDIFQTGVTSIRWQKWFMETDWSDCHSHSEHRFPTPSSKLCQI